MEKSVSEAFEELRQYVDIVMDDEAPRDNGLIIAGDPGVGKSWCIADAIMSYKGSLPEGHPMRRCTKIKVKTSALGLYRKLYTDNDRLLVFDDCDSMWYDKVSANILKAALDSTGDRELSYDVKGSFNPKYYSKFDVKRMLLDGKLPSPFTFTGRIIFITNLYMDELDTAVRDRCMCVELDLDIDQIWDLIELRINDKQSPLEIAYNPPLEAQLEVLEYMREEFDPGEAKIIKGKKGRQRKPSIRLFMNCAKLYWHTITKFGGSEALAWQRVASQIQ